MEAKKAINHVPNQKEVIMPPITEIEAITTLDNVLSQFQETSARDRILKWAWDKFSTKPMPPPETLSEGNKRPRMKKKGGAAKQPKTSTKGRPKLSIVKELNLTPKGKKAFKEFVKEKQPATNQEKCIVAVYYLSHELDLSDISINHIYTCYKDANWRVADLYNVLTLTAHRKGWVDTSNMAAITITNHGENIIEHDLPRQAKAKA
jgi:hypothetical protein